MSVELALIEEGTPRAMLWLEGGLTAGRALDGTWFSEPRTPVDMVMPDELADFRVASKIEASALAKEAAASSDVSPALASALLNAAS